MKHDYPTLIETLEMHALLLQAFGGAEGVRDLGALEAALMRSQMGYYDSLNAEAAALMESLANNHPFIDGNKRVAFFITDTFLRMNGFFINCDNLTAYAFFMKLFDNGEFHFEHLAKWLEDHTQPLI